MKQTVAGVVLMALICGSSLTAALVSCDIPGLQQQLRDKKISLAQFTKMYTDCITGKNTNNPASTGFQPSCSTDEPVAQAIVKFNNAGEFKASDGLMYPYHIRGVVTLTQLDSQTTRVHATISGTHSFLFDSNNFSLHVHQKGEIDAGCAATGGHYNPCGRNHSKNPAAEDRHVGDVAEEIIPANFASEQDILTFTKLDSQVKLTGSLSVLGRSITVHAGSGATRIGCGTIAVTEWVGEDHPDSTYSLSNPFWN